MVFSLPTLPYAKNGLEPYISEQTLNFHYDKHHQTYITNLNKIIEGTDFASLSLEDIVMKSAGSSEKAAIFNNAGQVWNHNFYWQCLKPQGGGLPQGHLAELIDRDFNSFEDFSKQFKQAAISQFGSGWAWLIQRADQKLEIMKTSNADLPMTHNTRALLTCDVWEHAYYLDYQNRRPDYADTFMKHLVNWEFVASNLQF